MGELVLVAGRDLFTASGGTEAYVLGQALAAHRAGYRPHVLSMGRRDETLVEPFGLVHRLASPVRPVRGITCMLQRRWLVPRIVELLRDRPGPHVIHSYGVWVDSAVLAARELRAQGVEVGVVATSFTVTHHETGPKLRSTVVRRSPRLLASHLVEHAWTRVVTARHERRGYLAADRVLANYRSVEALMHEHFDRRIETGIVTYAAPLAFREEAAPGAPAPALPDALAGLGGDGPLIVAVSRHDGRKGLDVLLRALGRLRDAGVPFRACLCGTGPLWDGHRRMVEDLRLGDRVVLPGRVPDVWPYLHHADVYVLPSLEEGSGAVAVLEALQAGVAIVASDVDGLPEDLTRDHDALLVPPGDEHALQHALAALATDPGLRERLGAAAHRTYAERFSADRVAAANAEVYAALGLPARTAAA